MFPPFLSSGGVAEAKSGVCVCVSLSPLSPDQGNFVSNGRGERRQIGESRERIRIGEEFATGSVCVSVCVWALVLSFRLVGSHAGRCDR